MADYLETCGQWRNDPYFDELDRQAVLELSDAQMRDRFSSELRFGTGGIRAVTGIGTNRINRYTIRKITQSLADELNARSDAQPSVVVAFDTRHHSGEFALETALTLCTNGIKVSLFREPVPTPVLSFSVRHLRCSAGVVITASHNPPQYNGYKVYDSSGCQIIDKETVLLDERIRSIDIQNVRPIDEEAAINSKLLSYLGSEVLAAFRKEVLLLSGSASENRIDVVYSPLHGTGAKPVPDVLRACGHRVLVVSEQALPDGSFPTLSVPNPEKPEAFSLAISLARASGAPLVMVSDPDCDRIGVAVSHHGDYRILSGNQVGALLIRYLCIRDSARINASDTVIKTIVTSDFGADIAASYGICTLQTLTGFKNIGHLIDNFEADPISTRRTFFFGYEESCGYLYGTHSRDKDAVSAAMLISEMCAHYLSLGLTLVDVLEQLFQQFGYYADALETHAFEDPAEPEEIMARVRSTGASISADILCVKDYLRPTDGLPQSNVLKLCFDPGSWIAIRPSGTEPLLKIYYSAKGETANLAKRKLADLMRLIQQYIEPAPFSHKTSLR